MTGTPGEALDTDEAVRALEDALPLGGAGDTFWFRFVERINEQGVTLVWGGPAKPPAVVDAMRAAGWTENEIGAAMDGRYRGAALDRAGLPGTPTEGKR